MFTVLENGQVMRTEVINDNEITEHFCMFKETKRERLNNQYKVTTLEFNVDTGKQEVANEVYEPVPIKELVQELKEDYLPLIKDADLLGDLAEKEQLQNEYLQKKTELESAQ